MSIFESLENLNVSEECYNDIYALINEKLVDVVNRAMRKGTLPPFRKGTRQLTPLEKWGMETVQL